MTFHTYILLEQNSVTRMSDWTGILQTTKIGVSKKSKWYCRTQWRNIRNPGSLEFVQKETRRDGSSVEEGPQNDGRVIWNPFVSGPGNMRIRGLDLPPLILPQPSTSTRKWEIYRENRWQDFRKTERDKEGTLCSLESRTENEVTFSSLILFPSLSLRIQR